MEGAQTLPFLGNSYDTFRDKEVANFYVGLHFDRSHAYGTKILVSLLTISLVGVKHPVT